MLKDATSSDANPTPGYLLNTICRTTISSYQACTELQEFLLTRLKSNNGNTKYKCLTIIKVRKLNTPNRTILFIYVHILQHVCRSGRADFKNEMTKKVDPIRDCLRKKKLRILYSINHMRNNNN